MHVDTREGELFSDPAALFLNSGTYEDERPRADQPCIDDRAGWPFGGPLGIDGSIQILRSLQWHRQECEEGVERAH